VALEVWFAKERYEAGRAAEEPGGAELVYEVYIAGEDGRLWLIFEPPLESTKPKLFDDTVVVGIELYVLDTFN